jgi:hypothetical protein
MLGERGLEDLKVSLCPVAHVPEEGISFRGAKDSPLSFDRQEVLCQQRNDLTRLHPPLLGLINQIQGGAVGGWMVCVPGGHFAGKRCNLAVYQCLSA